MMVLVRRAGTRYGAWEIKGPFPAFFDISAIIADLAANPRYDVVTVVHGIHLDRVVQLMEEDRVVSGLSAALCIREMDKLGLFSLPGRDGDDDYADDGGYSIGDDDDDFDDDDDDNAGPAMEDGDLPPFFPS